MSIALKMPRPAFTLTELLIALTVLGLIATFTIPKLLNNYQYSQANAIAKEAASSVNQAITAYEHSSPLATDLSVNTIFQSTLGYVEKDMSSIVDSFPNGSASATGIDCAAYDCYRLHNGAMIAMDPDTRIPGNNANDAIFIFVDPDGKFSDLKAVAFAVYVNHRIRTYGSLVNPTTGKHSAVLTFSTGPVPNRDPDWFAW